MLTKIIITIIASNPYMIAFAFIILYISNKYVSCSNNSNLFEQKKYEDNIKITFTKSIINKLIEKLSMDE